MARWSWPLSWPSQVLALDVAAEPGAEQVVGQPARALGDVAPGEAAFAEDEAHLVGAGRGDGLVDFGDRELSRHGSANLDQPPGGPGHRTAPADSGTVPA